MGRAVQSGDCRTLAKGLIYVGLSHRALCSSERYLHAHFLPGEGAHGFSDTVLGRDDGAYTQRAWKLRAWTSAPALAP